MRYALLVIMALVAIPAAAREAVNPSAFNPTSVPTRHYRLDPAHASVVASGPMGSVYDAPAAPPDHAWPMPSTL